MFIIEMIDSWDRTVMSWCVDCSKEAVEEFVDTLNDGLSNKLEKQAKSNEEYYFDYKEFKVSTLPTETELIELMKPSEFELEMRNSTYDSGLTLEDIKNWDITQVTDFTNMFK